MMLAPFVVGVVVVGVGVLYVGVNSSRRTNAEDDGRFRLCFDMTPMFVGTNSNKRTVNKREGTKGCSRPKNRKSKENLKEGYGLRGSRCGSQLLCHCLLVALLMFAVF